MCEGPLGIATGYGSVWVVCYWRRHSFASTPIRAGSSPGSAWATARSASQPARGVWVTNRRSHRVTRVDPRTNTVAATIRFDGDVSPYGVAVGGGGVWAPSRGASNRGRGAAERPRSIRGSRANGLRSGEQPLPRFQHRFHNGASDALPVTCSPASVYLRSCSAMRNGSPGCASLGSGVTTSPSAQGVRIEALLDRCVAQKARLKLNDGVPDRMPTLPRTG